MPSRSRAKPNRGKIRRRRRRRRGVRSGRKFTYLPWTPIRKP
jgi:hypothetical protein